MLKTLLILVLMTGLFTALGAIIPDPIVAGIDAAIVFFLTYLHYLSPIMHVDTVFACLTLLANFIAFNALYVGAKWIFLSSTR